MTLRRSALLVLPALTLSLTPVHSADAAASSWKTLVAVNGGKVQACKVPTPASDPWKFRFRVNAVKAASRVQGSAMRYRHETKLRGGWSSGWVRPGRVSDVAVVRLPRGSAYTLAVGLGAGQMGDGGSFRPTDIPRC